MVTIEQIKELREITDAPIQYCKQALEKTNSNIDEAKEELKRMGQASVRTVLPKFGAIGVYQSKLVLFIAVGKCETDFVAKNEKFIHIVDETAISFGMDPNCYEGFKEETFCFKENCLLETHEFDYEGYNLAYYLHHNRQRLAAVRYKGENKDAAIKVSTHIVATSPKYTNRDEMPTEELIELEKSLTEKARLEGKPEKSIEMIVKGQMKKKLSEFVLMDQPFYADAKITVEQYCKNNNINIINFINVLV
jgi:elongation factor Ts